MDVWFCRAQEPMPRGIHCVLNILKMMTCTLSRACPGHPCFAWQMTYMEVGLSASELLPSWAWANERVCRPTGLSWFLDRNEKLRLSGTFTICSSRKEKRKRDHGGAEWTRRPRGTGASVDTRIESAYRASFSASVQSLLLSLRLMACSSVTLPRSPRVRTLATAQRCRSNEHRFPWQLEPDPYLQSASLRRLWSFGSGPLPACSNDSTGLLAPVQWWSLQPVLTWLTSWLRTAPCLLIPKTSFSFHFSGIISLDEGVGYLQKLS